MTDYVRMIVGGGVVAGGIALGAWADEPQFFDASRFRHYDVAIADTVSTDIQSTKVISKIGYGYKSAVTIVTTPSGTYSSDALLSPYMRYPGIAVSAKRRWESSFWYLDTGETGGDWSSYSSGSMLYYGFHRAPASRT